MSDKLSFVYDSEVFIDLYNLLGIEDQAKPEEIKAAYLKLVKTNHPDHGGNADMYQRITEAYEILSNKESRKDYDLYYLKKNMEEFKGDDIFRLKSDYKNFVDANVKPISEDRLNEIYADIFKDKDKYKEIKIEKDELSRRIDDISFERKNEDIESNDEKIAKIFNELNEKLENPITISEFFEYCQHKMNSSKSRDIMVRELGTLDTMPGYSNGYTSFVSDTEYFANSFYSDISNENNFVSQLNTVDSDDFNQWRKSKKIDTKLSSNEIEDYLNRRREEEQTILKEVESNLSSVSKKREIQRFLKLTHIVDELELNTNEDDLINNQNNSDSIDLTSEDVVVDNKSVSEITIDEIIKEREKDIKPINMSKDNDKFDNKPKGEEVVITKKNNVRKRELK